MAKSGFLSVLEEEIGKHLTFDYAIDWDRKNHTVEVAFILEAQGQSVIETVNDQGEISNDDIVFEDYVLFYNQAKPKVDEDDYLVTIPFDAKRGFSREFLACPAETLNDVATKDLNDLMDFLADENTTNLVLEWGTGSFENGKAKLKKTEYFAYPRY